MSAFARIFEVNSTMKALSIQQPWAYCITNGTKRVENRTWFSRFRGDLLIHAGKQYQTELERYIHADSPEVDVAGMLGAPRGAIVGICRMIDCIRPGDDARLPIEQRIWADPEQFKFLLTDIRAFAQPIPYKGSLGFFDVPESAVENALHALQQTSIPV